MPSQLAQIEEQMKLTMTEMIAERNGEKVTVEDYINNLADKGKVNVTDTYEEDGKQIVVVDDKYVFEVADGEPYATVDKVGIKDKLPPVIILESITGTTNSIKVTVTTKRNEGGTIKFSIKQEGDSDYGSEVTKTETDASCTFTGLEQNKKYNIKILATAENKQTAELLVDKTLGSVPDLATGDITFTYTVDGQEINKETWTNKSVTVTASTEITGYTLQTSKDGRTWYDVRNQTFTENGKIYAVLYDGKNYGGSATGNVTNIDTTKPIVTEATATTNSIAITATDEASGIVGYAVTTSNTAPTSFTSCTSTKSLSTTVSGKTQGTTYYVWVKDAAGNISNSKSTGTGNVTSLQQGDVVFTFNPSGWRNGSVKVTAALKEGLTSDYTLKITNSDPRGANKATAIGWANASEGITVSSNTAVYGILVDSEGQIGGAASGNVINIDTTAPTISTALSSTAQGIDSVTLSVGIKDANSGLGKVEWYYGTTNNPTTLAGTTKVTDLNGSTKGPTAAQTKTFTVTGLSAGTTYYFKVIAYDVAGNTTSSTVISASTLNPTAADVSYTPSDSSWGVDNVKSALDSLYSR